MLNIWHKNAFFYVWLIWVAKKWSSFRKLSKPFTFGPSGTTQLVSKASWMNFISWPLIWAKHKKMRFCVIYLTMFIIKKETTHHLFSYQKSCNSIFILSSSAKPWQYNLSAIATYVCVWGRNIPPLLHRHNTLLSLSCTILQS